MPPTIRMQKKRDAWERKVMISKAQAESSKKMCRMYENDFKVTVDKYKMWLDKYKIDPLMELNFE